MKLFRFPVLVFENIIKQLEPVPLVSLSFCSKKTRERIKKVSFAIKQVLLGNEYEKKPGYAFEVVFSPQQYLFLSFQALTSEFEKGAKKFSVQVGDIPYDCRYLVEEQQAMYLDCIDCKKASIFFNYILDLVRAGITDISIDLNKLVDIKQFTFDLCFKNVQKIRLEGESVPGEKLTELYDCFKKPIVETYVQSNIPSLSPTSKLLQSQNLLLNPSKFISIEHLLNFTGKYIELESTSLLEEDIVAFIKHWLDGNYPNLEGAIITTPEGRAFETEKILDEFNTKRWNPAERAKNFIFKASYRDNEENGIPILDCSNGHDLERCDGLLATMQFGEREYDFYFYVWHTRFPS